ncbi:MAG: AbrB/MazE/SpoVT family DNA-binding domain-containing protein [Spirochaetia bacterium]|nr:AbrB/MazE/SpoVT family DNA-binding domain-containing protein [Spirochaetia bacterium]
MYTVTATQKGQIVIPAKIRKKLHIKKGTKLYIQEDGVQILIKPATPEYIDSMVGYLGPEKNMSELLLKERKTDDEVFMKKIEKWLK